MATNDVFNPTLQPVTNSPSISPLRLEGSANMLGAVGEIGKSVLELASIKTKDKVLTDLNSRLQSLDQEAFLQRPEDMEKLTGMVNEYATQDLYQQNLTQNPTFQTGEEVDAAISTQEQVKNDLLGQITRFKQAQVQGSMSATEFNNRALAATREAVALNPQLTSELLTTLSHHMKLSGASNRLEMIEKSNKSFLEQNQTQGKYYAQQLDGFYSGASAKYFDQATGFWDIPGMTAELSVYARRKFTDDEVKRNLENKKYYTQAEAQEAYDNGTINDIVLNRKTDFNFQIQDILMKSKPEDLESNIKQIIGEHTLKLNTEYGQFAQANPAIKATFDNMIKYYESYGQSIIDKGTGKVSAELAKNSLEFLRATSDEEFIKVVGNPKALDLFMTLANSQNYALMVKEDPAAAKSTRERFVGIALGTSKLISKDFTPPANGKPSTGRVITEAAIDVLKDPKATADSKATATDVISQAIIHIKENPNPNESFSESTNLISRIATADSKNINSISPTQKSEIESLIMDNNSLIFKEVVKYKNKGVTFSFTPDGLLSADTSSLVSDIPNVSNETLQKQFQTGVVARLNDSLKAYANLNGITTKAAAQEFYTKFYKGTFDNEDIPKLDYEAMAKKRMPGIAIQESGGNMYDKKGSYIMPYAKPEDVPADPRDRVFGKYQIMVGSAMNPGLGVAPLNFTLSGTAFDKDQERFATEYYTALLTKYKGDEVKALTAYNSGIGRVDNLIEKFGNDWYSKGVELYKKDKKNGLGPQGAAYAAAIFKRSGFDGNKEGSTAEQDVIQKTKVDSINEALNSLAPLEKNHPELASQLFSDPLQKAKYVANKLVEQGISVDWKEVKAVMDRPASGTKLDASQAKLDDVSWLSKVSSEVLGYDTNEMTKLKAAVARDAVEIQRSPEFATLTNEQQNYIMGIIDPPLENLNPEAWFAGGKVGFNMIKGIVKKVGPKFFARTQNVVNNFSPKTNYEPTPINKLMKDQKIKDKFAPDAAERTMNRAVAKATEKVAKTRARGE